MTEPGPDAAGAAPVPAAVDPRKEIIRLTRRVERLELTLRQLEDIRDTSARLVDRFRDELAAEQSRSLELLLNILPRLIVDRLNAGEHPIADRHEGVAVVIGDLVGFTTIAARLPADDLVEQLGALFGAFDAAAERRGVDKIKTIGDAYLAVAGLAPADDDPATAVRTAAYAAADLAFDMIDAVAAIGSPWRIRVGLAVGPIAAGVIGTQRFAYDVWGDTVNFASRLEQMSEPGRVHVSEEVASILNAGFITEPRGQVWLKGMGDVPTWFVLGRRSDPELHGADAVTGLEALGATTDTADE